MAKKLKQHEKINLERQIRKYVRCDGDFRKGITNAEKITARALLTKAGRKKVEWDHSIDLNTINTKSVVKPKVGKNSID